MPNSEKYQGCYRQDRARQNMQCPIQEVIRVCSFSSDWIPTGCFIYILNVSEIPMILTS